MNSNEISGLSGCRTPTRDSSLLEDQQSRSFQIERSGRQGVNRESILHATVVIISATGGFFLDYSAGNGCAGSIPNLNKNFRADVRAGSTSSW